MIAVDDLPPSFTIELGFKGLMEFLKPVVNVMSPRTMEGMLEDLAKKRAMPSLAAHLAQCPSRSLHFIVDVWSSGSRDSIIGVKVQFVSNWKLNTYTLAFKHFPGNQTSDRIPGAFEQELFWSDALSCVRSGALSVITHPR